MKPQERLQTTNWEILIQLYNRRAKEEYPFIPGRGPRVLSRKHRGIIAFLKALSVNSRILDAGCGDGVYCEWLSRNGYRSIIGVDISTHILVTARRNVINWGNISVVHFAAGNLEKLPFVNASFDVVVCSQVIEHLLDERAGLNEIYRVLRSGGLLVISTDNRDNLVSRWLSMPVILIRTLLHRPKWEYPFPHRAYRLTEFLAYVMEAGFRIQRAETYRFSLPPSLSRVPGLVRLLDWIECRLIRLPGIRQWGDIIVVIAYKP